MLPPETAVLSVNTILPLKVILDAKIISAAPRNPLNVESVNSSSLSSLIIEQHPLYPFPSVDILDSRTNLNVQTKAS
jgi:hypothetical protein